MKEEKLFLKFLYHCARNIKDDDLSTLNLDKFIKTSSINRVSNILYYGVKNKLKENIEISNENLEQIKSECMVFGVKELKQQMEFSKIENDFKNANIKMIAMKGIVLKNLYSSKDMRVMGDIDMIVDQKDYLLARDILINKLNYKVNNEDLVELCATNNQNITVELHQHLVTELSNNQKYFDDTYKDNIILTGLHYEFTHTYHFIYMMDHIYKHFIEGGLSLKYILDFALYIEKYPSVIKDTLGELNKLSLSNITLGFLQICRDFLDMNVEENISIFDKKINEDAIKTLLLLMIQHGEYGTVESRVNAKTVQGTFFKRILRRLFPPVIRPKHRSKILEIIIYPFRLLGIWFGYFLMNLKYVFFVFKQKSQLSDSEKNKLSNMYNEMK